MVAILEGSEVEHVGDYEFRIRFGEATAESETRWQHRSDVLAQWLKDEWKRQQRKEALGAGQ